MTYVRKITANGTVYRWYSMTFQVHLLILSELEGVQPLQEQHARDQRAV